MNRLLRSSSNNNNCCTSDFERQQRSASGIIHSSSSSSSDDQYDSTDSCTSSIDTKENDNGIDKVDNKIHTSNIRNEDDDDSRDTYLGTNSTTTTIYTSIVSSSVMIRLGVPVVILAIYLIQLLGSSSTLSTLGNFRWNLSSSSSTSSSSSNNAAGTAVTKMNEEYQEQKEATKYLYNKEKVEELSKIYKNPNHIMTLLDMPDLLSELGIKINTYYPENYTNSNDNSNIIIPITREMISNNDDRLLVWEIINRSGLRIDHYVYSALPTWEQVQTLYGNSNKDNNNNDNKVTTTTTSSTNDINSHEGSKDSSTKGAADENQNKENNSNKKKTLYGNYNTYEPIIIGKETCELFRSTVPISERYIGVAGQMNTGTNILSSLLYNNLILPKTIDTQGGILWTVPWYKHGWISMRHHYNYLSIPNNHTNVLPITIIRDPYFWMKSMCQSPYTMKWNQSTTHCPNLIDNMSHSNRYDKGIHVNIRWGKSYARTWPSLAHVWSSWYSEYYMAGTNKTKLILNKSNDNNNSDHKQKQQQTKQIIPRLMIRFEDLLFYPERVIDEIRDCVGAEWKYDLTNNTSIVQLNVSESESYTTGSKNANDDDDGTSTSSKITKLSIFYKSIKEHFVYRTVPSKTNAYFSRYKTHQSSMVSAMIKYGSEGVYNTRRIHNMTQADLAYARNYLDETLLNVFHYTHPTVL